MDGDDVPLLVVEGDEEVVCVDSSLLQGYTLAGESRRGQYNKSCRLAYVPSTKEILTSSSEHLLYFDLCSYSFVEIKIETISINRVFSRCRDFFLLYLPFSLFQEMTPFYMYVSGHHL